MLRRAHHTVLLAVPQSTQRTAEAIKRRVGEGLRCLFLFPVLRLFAPVKIEGREYVRGAGPFLFAANHASHLDAPVVLAALPVHLRMHVRVAAAADYFFSRRWKGWLASTLLNAFPFERRAPGCARSLKQTQRLLNAGQSVLIFPEGTRSKDGSIQPFKRGVGLLALGGARPVIPIHIEGTYAAWPRGARWPRRQQVVVQFGAPLSFSTSEEPLCVAAQIEQAVRKMARTLPEQRAA